jgi:toxin ParE1/3/4
LAFFLTHKAKSDLISIARYTQKEWGIGQRDLYLRNLDKAFHELSELPGKGRKCDHIIFGYRSYRVGKHVIYFRQLENDIEIVRILHERMDVDRHL